MRKCSNVVCVVDQDFEYHSELGDLGVDVLRISGFGVGKALRYGFKYAVDVYDPDWIIRTDAHVKFLDDFHRLLRHERFVCSGVHHTPEGGVSYGLMVNPYDWSFVWNTTSRIISMTHECTIAFSRFILENYSDYIWNIPYWGKENIDTTLTLARLGHPTLVTDFNLIHYYKKEWNPKRIENRKVVESWFTELCCGSNPYFMGSHVSDVMFAIRHYREPEVYPFWRKIPQMAKYIVNKYFDVYYVEAPFSIFDLTLNIT